MSAIDLETLLGVPNFSTHLQQINEGLRAAIADADPAIRDAALPHVLIQGKRLRPAMVLAVVHAVGKPINKRAISACVAIELAHISSLIHDDIIDKAESRRGIPTISSKQGINQAIIVGDYLLAQACAEAGTVNAEASRVIATAVARICDGQSREVADQYNIDRDGESMLSSIRGKTAELFAAACRVGGICAGLPANELDNLSSFGEKFGMAFQLIDDVFDFVSNEALLGKSIGKDVVDGVYTMPVLLALRGPQKEIIRAVLTERSQPANAFTELLISGSAIGKTIEAAEQFSAQAADSLRPLVTATRKLDKLIHFPDTYLAWSLAAFIAPEYKARLLHS